MFEHSCKSFVEAEKQIGLWKMPKVLIVHFKRFAFLNNRFREKLDDRVSFPLEELDLSPHMLSNSPQKNRVKYELVGVANHMGGLGGGHYTAYTKHFKTGEWWLFNDEKCSRVTDVSQVVSKNAYLLFYVRKD